MSRPKRAKNDKSIRDASREPARLQDPRVQQIIQIEEVNPVKVAGSAISGLLKLFLLLVFVLLALYLAITATLMTATPGEAGLTWVARSTFIGGEPAAGDYAYVTSQEEPNSGPFGKVLQGFVPLPDASVVEIIAGPAGEVSNTKDGSIAFNGKETDFTFPIEKRKLLGEYLAICITGACEPGEQLLIDHTNLVGEAKGKITIRGIEEYSQPTETPAPLKTEEPVTEPTE